MWYLAAWVGLARGARPGSGGANKPPLRQPVTSRTLSCRRSAPTHLVPVAGGQRRVRGGGFLLLNRAMWAGLSAGMCGARDAKRSVSSRGRIASVEKRAPRGLAAPVHSFVPKTPRRAHNKLGPHPGRSPHSPPRLPVCRCVPPTSLGGDGTAPCSLSLGRVCCALPPLPVRARVGLLAGSEAALSVGPRPPVPLEPDTGTPARAHVDRMCRMHPDVRGGAAWRVPWAALGEGPQLPN